MAKDMTIVVNGFPERFPLGVELDLVIDQHQARHKDLIVELNGRFVFNKDYSTTRLNDGDKVELIHAAFGG